MTEAQMWRSVWQLWALVGGLPLLLWIALMVVFDLDFSWVSLLIMIGWGAVWFYVILKAARDNKASHDELKEDQ